MSRIDWLRDQKALYEMRARKAAYPAFFGYAIRLYDELISKEEKLVKK